MNHSISGMNNKHSNNIASAYAVWHMRYISRFSIYIICQLGKFSPGCLAAYQTSSQLVGHAAPRSCGGHQALQEQAWLLSGRGCSTFVTHIMFVRVLLHVHVHIHIHIHVHVHIHIHHIHTFLPPASASHGATGSTTRPERDGGRAVDSVPNSTFVAHVVMLL